MAERQAPVRTAAPDTTATVDPANAPANAKARRPVREGWRNADFSAVPTRSSGAAPPALLDRIVRTLPATGGQALPDQVGRALHDATGLLPPPATRVRTGPSSAGVARALDPRALTTPDGAIHLGESASAGDNRLLLHEAVHTLQQPGGGTGAVRLSEPDDAFEANAREVASAAERSGSGQVLVGRSGVIHRDVVSDVKDKLSYKLLDWAITDADASTAFALLDGVPDPDLPGVLTKLGPSTVSRLLDNLPSGLKTGPRYTRVVQALGPAATLPFVLDQLQTGLFDWAVTDAEVDQVFNVYANLAPAQQDAFWTMLAARGRLAKLISNVSEAHEILFVRPWVKTLVKGATPAEPNPNAALLTDAHKTVLRTMVEETGSRVTADLLLEARFNVTVHRLTASKEKRTGDDKKVGTDFSLAQLRRLWVLLEALPPGHTVANPELDRLTRYEGGPESPGGVYYGGLDEAAIGAEGTGNFFADIVRHEVGHAVDAKIGWTAGGEPTRAERGGWTEYGSASEAATDATTLSKGGIAKLTAADRAAVEAEMATVMGTPAQGLADLKKAIRGLPLWAALPAEARGAAQREALGDAALTAVTENRVKNRPWGKDEGGVRLGDRIIQQSYPGDGGWTSYSYSFRKKSAVSRYQFRAPAEWFAEAYVSYFAKGTDTDIDELSTKDPDTNAWFEKNVDEKKP